MKQKALTYFTILTLGSLSLLLMSCAPSASASISPNLNTTATPLPPLPEDIAAATSIASPNKVPLDEISVALDEMQENAESQLQAPKPTPITGIHSDGMLFEGHPPRTVDVRNVWQDEVSGQLIKVWAGRLKPDYRNPNHPADTQHGTILFEVYGDDTWCLRRSQFQTIDENGALVITEVSIGDQNFVVHLEAENGIRYKFDSNSPKLEAVD